MADSNRVINKRTSQDIEPSKAEISVEHTVGS